MMLQIEKLCAGYRGSRVLKDLDLAIPAGTITALLGRNGMGKTTLLRTVMGLIPATSGRVLFDQREITRLRPYEISNLGVAYVPQGREIFADFSVEENLRLGRIGKVKGAGAPADKAYDYFPFLAQRRGQKAGTLSGGQQQQLAIARALVGDPKLLLLDEPSEGVQPSIVSEMARNLQQVASGEGLTVLLVEQNVDMVLSTASTCAFIENGRIVARHPVEEVRGDRDILRRHLSV